VPAFEVNYPEYDDEWLAIEAADAEGAAAAYVQKQCEIDFELFECFEGDGDNVLVRGGDETAVAVVVVVTYDPIYSASRVRWCRVCRCTDADCSQCVAKTGEPCTWVEADLCSACMDHPETRL
jgi:hypothetical protein